MRTIIRYAALAAAACLLVPSVAAAEERPARTGRLHNLKVLSDKVDDVSTVENILKSFVKPRMTDAERARALWTAAVKYRHQAPPPNEFLAADWEAHDPVKLFNVYGYCMCCCSSALIEALNRLDGREVRGRILTGHSVPEVFYDGSWHMLYAQEEDDRFDSRTLFTNRAIEECMKSDIPIGILRKERKADPYEVIGLGLPIQWQDKFFAFVKYQPNSSQDLPGYPETKAEQLTMNLGVQDYLAGEGTD